MSLRREIEKVSSTFTIFVYLYLLGHFLYSYFGTQKISFLVDEKAFEILIIMTFCIYIVPTIQYFVKKKKITWDDWFEKDKDEL